MLKPKLPKTDEWPRKESDKSVNIGVAAHITAASSGGPRYDKDLSSLERKSIENAIWLCQNCAKLIDNDPNTYTTDLLRRWKSLSEEAARLGIEISLTNLPTKDSGDIDLIKFYAQCFDRPAFQDPFRQEGSMEAFDKAIEDTITAINTGALRARDGAVLSQSKGKAFLSNIKWRQQMDTIVDLLRAIRSRYDLAVKLNQISVSPSRNGETFYCINDHEIAEWMDSTRFQILRLFSEVCAEANLQAPIFPRHHRGFR